VVNINKITPNLVKADGSRTPVGTLAGYSVTSSSIPVDPRDTGGQVPTFGATVTEVDGDPKALAEQDVVLTDWTRGETTGRIAAVDRSVTSGIAQLDVNTIYEKLNTTQTTLPVVTPPGTGNPVDLAIEHWMLMAGVPRKRWEGNLHSCLQANWTDNYGYIGNSISKLRMMNTQEQAQFDVFVPTVDTYMPPIEVNAVQSAVFALNLWATTVLSEARFHMFVPSTNETVRYTVGHNGTSYYLKQKVGAAAETTLISKTYTALYTSDVYMFVKVSVGGTADQVNATIRLMEFDDVNQLSVYSDTTVNNITAPLLRKRPRPFKIESGWDQSLQTLGVPTGGKPDAVVVTDVMPTQVPGLNASFILLSGYLDIDANWPNAVPGFTANVWDKIREFCSLLEIDVAFDSGILTFTSRAYARTDSSDGTYLPTSNVPKSGLSESVATRETARSVEVDYRTMAGDYYADYYPGNGLLWKADSVYSLEKGETKVEIVQTDSSIVFLNQPVPVAGVPVPYTNAYGAYVITGNDGYIVDPQWWKDNGGSITVKPTGTHGEVEITLQAPTVDTVRAPYRVSEGVADRPALYLFGKGLRLAPAKTAKIYTGYPEAAQDVGAKLESPFVTSKIMAFNAGNKIAAEYGTAASKINFRISQADLPEPEDSNSPLTLVNDSVYWAGSHYRVSDQTITHGAIQVSDAQRFNTIAGVNGEFATGKTIADWNALHAGKLIRDTNIAPLPRYEG
jgi:hypothetical protein